MQTKNSTLIEQAAITKLKDALARTGIVNAQITENDKTLSWDGELQIYEAGESFSKSLLKGRIPVQVKGTVVKSFPTKPYATFQADVNDLKNYLNDGGVLFFVVQLRDFDDYRIYYAPLLPIDLRKLLNQAGTCQSKSIRLEQLPHNDADTVSGILLDFFENKKKQSQLLPAISSLRDLDDSGIEIAQFGFAVPTYGLTCMEDVFDRMLHHPHYVYATPKNVPVSFAVDKFWVEQIIMHCDSPVYVNGERLFDRIDVIRKADKNLELKIGEHFTITFNQDHLHFQHNTKGSLREQIRTVKLLSAFANGEEIRFGDFLLPPEKANLHDRAPDEVTAYLHKLQRYQKTLDTLYIHKDLQMDDLSDADMQKLDWLADSILDHNPVPISLNGRSGAGMLRIGNIAALLLLCESSNENEFFLQDFLNQTDCTLILDTISSEKKILASPYVMLTLDILQQVDNIDFHAIVPSIMQYSYHIVYGDRIWQLSEALLKYYDYCKREDLLDIVIQLMDFLQENDPDRNIVYQVNRLQAEKRRRMLTKEELQYLLEVKSTIVSKMLLLMVNVLLESFQEAQIIYDTLDDLERESFNQSPIRHIWHPISSSAIQ